MATAELVLEVVPRLIILSHGEYRAKARNKDNHADLENMEMFYE